MKNNYLFVSVLLAGTLFLGACSNPFESLADDINSFITDEPSDNDATDEETSETASGTEDAEVENSEDETIDYTDLMDTGEETTLSEGTHEGGADIPAGRYVVTADSGFGNLIVNDEAERLIYNDVLNGEDDMADYGADRAVLFVDDGFSIEISGMESVQFTPYETTEVTELFPGLWIAGEDFPAGVYDLSLEETDEFGSLQVYTHPDHQKSRHSLGNSDYGGMTSFTTSFEEGDVVELMRIPELTLTER